MKPVNLAAQLAAVETELTCLKMVLAQVREDRDGLQQERDAWRTVAKRLNDCALREADRRRLTSLGGQFMAAPTRGRLGADVHTNEETLATPLRRCLKSR